MSTKKVYFQEGGFILGRLKPVFTMKMLILHQLRHTHIQDSFSLTSKVPVVMPGLQA